MLNPTKTSYGMLNLILISAGIKLIQIDLLAIQKSLQCEIVGSSRHHGISSEKIISKLNTVKLG